MNTELLGQLKQFADDASLRASEFSGIFGNIQRYILDNFGQNGLYAFYIALAAVGLFVLIKLAKIAFSTLKYMVIPAVALAFAGSFFVPASFVVLLPITVVLCAVFLLVKG